MFVMEEVSPKERLGRVLRDLGAAALLVRSHSAYRTRSSQHPGTFGMQNQLRPLYSPTQKITQITAYHETLCWLQGPEYRSSCN